MNCPECSTPVLQEDIEAWSGYAQRLLSIRIAVCKACGWVWMLSYEWKKRCTHDPSATKGPIGMYHCPECGEMVVAGAPHPNYDWADTFPQWADKQRETEK